MTIENLYYFAELVGVLAVVVSVLYLAQQVKASNDLNRTNTFRTIFQGLAAHSNEMFGVWLQNRLFPYRGVRDWWAHGRGLWPADFRAWVDAQADAASPGDDVYGIATIDDGGPAG